MARPTDQELGATRNGGQGGELDVRRYREMLLQEVDLDELDRLSSTQRRARLERLVGHIISRDGPIMSSTERRNLIRRIVDEALGLGVLEPLLADPNVTEIMVNGPNQVYVERAGTLTLSNSRFSSEEQMYQTIDRIVSQVNRRVDEASPMVDARLPTGERVNVIIPPLSLNGPVLTIRRFPRAFTMAQLAEMGSVDEATMWLLRSMVEVRCNIIIAGGTGTGKTTFLNSLSGYIGASERIVTIEDSAELQLQQPHVVRLESRPPNVEGKGQVTIRDLVKNSLRMRPDRIIVGEVRGGETLDMLQAMNTGHEGSLCTVHANSVDDAILRLETLASMTELDIAFEALRDQISGAVDALVHLRRYPDGSRRVAQIAVTASQDRKTFQLDPVMTFEADPMEAERRVTGRVKHGSIPAWLAERFRLASISLHPVFRAAPEPEAVGR
ncbi:CpaF family protein [Euzebya tangerina]|uniref:CpaF family protein n=1 Tax=Euzebya tangerina TaxID=591198 RepID=UPI000E319EA5|nr:CpaF family protein [Euzebya tangerina]